MATTSSQIPVPAPLRLSGNLAGDWKRFRGQWTNYARAVKLEDEDDARQTAIFLACIGSDAYTNCLKRFSLKKMTIGQSFDVTDW
jgi:hypothetical protein